MLNYFKIEVMLKIKTLFKSPLFHLYFTGWTCYLCWHFG